MEIQGEENNTKKEKSLQAQQIKSSIKNLEKELHEIQDKCSHKVYAVENCQKENSGFLLRKVCKECQKEIGYPSQDEIDSWANS